MVWLKLRTRLSTTLSINTTGVTSCVKACCDRSRYKTLFETFGDFCCTTEQRQTGQEIANVESWANHNNLKLNHAKSAEIIFVRPRSKTAVRIPTRTISGFVCVELLTVLGVTISRKFSVAKHEDELLTSCAQSLFTLRTLRLHGLPTEALR